MGESSHTIWCVTHGLPQYWSDQPACFEGLWNNGADCVMVKRK